MNFSKLPRRLRWLLALALGAQSQAHAANFTPDPKIQRIAEAYALDARDFAERAFHITLDWSDASVEKVEVILDDLHRQKQVMKPPPTEEQVVNFAKMLGSYIGEVFRRNHGAEWGMVTLGAAAQFRACAPPGPSISSGRWARCKSGSRTAPRTMSGTIIRS